MTPASSICYISSRHVGGNTEPNLNLTILRSRHIHAVIRMCQNVLQVEKAAPDTPVVKLTSRDITLDTDRRGVGGGGGCVVLSSS